MKPRHVFVRWLDTRAHAGWAANKETKKESALGVWSSGFVVADTKREIKLAQNFCDTGETNGREVIPRGCIVKILENPVPFTVDIEEE